MRGDDDTDGIGRDLGEEHRRGAHARPGGRTGSQPGTGRRRVRRTGKWLKGLLITIVVLALFAGGLIVGVRWGLEQIGGPDSTPLWGPACSVETADGTVGLSTEQARTATTAAALRVRGEEGPDTSGIDPAVMERLEQGPPDDAGPSLGCRASSAEGIQEEEMTETGLTPRAMGVLEAMGEVFGEQSLGGYEPGGLNTGHGTDSAHYDGRAIDVFYRPVSEENRRSGWVLAHWLVAHSEELDIDVVIFDDQIWSVQGSLAGWRGYNSPDPDNEILRHLDHVHVDVQRGG